jgi:hypothetical protein
MTEMTFIGNCDTDNRHRTGTTTTCYGWAIRGLVITGIGLNTIQETYTIQRKMNGIKSVNVAPA